jgi:hypothetical protein
MVLHKIEMKKIAKIQIENSKLNIDQQSLALNAQLATSSNVYD